MTADEFQDYLDDMGACEEARVWAMGKTDKQAWARCSDPRWLYWWLFHTGANILSALRSLRKANVPTWGPEDTYSMWHWRDGITAASKQRICRLIRKNFKCPTL